MNHFLLASGSISGQRSASYGVNAMELLINGLLKLGAERGRLRARVYGGARMMSGLGDVGIKNAEFAIDFLKSESIRVLGSSTGGTQARRITLWPASGLVKELFVGRNLVETPPSAAETASSDTGGLELF
ncbi:chemotaxis protein CheD [Paracoccus aerodenitrificans]|uniref:chemotaxis protein CheD n=1 Tax=Paracoccus aerodenitrificans TaxID=3017781 RepID=UPI0022F0800F|nr:chemotaxis protein CheD [Paracoccus aerodenitrificans]